MTAPCVPRRPTLRHGVRTRPDPLSDQTLLLFPEGVLLLNDTAAEVVVCCDGQHEVSDILSQLHARYERVPADDVLRVLQFLADNRLLMPDA